MPHDSNHTSSFIGPTAPGPLQKEREDRRRIKAPSASDGLQENGRVEHASPASQAESNPRLIRLSRAAPATVSKTRARLIVPMGIAGVIAAIIISSLLQTEEPHTVAEVVRQVREIAMRTSERPGVEDGGPLGPMWIAARDVDVRTGTLTAVRLRAGQVRLAAREGRIIVDPSESTISFSLEHVVMFRVPGGATDAEFGDSIMELDSFVLGPVPYKRRIVADGHPAGERNPPKHLAGVRPEE